MVKYEWKKVFGRTSSKIALIVIAFLVVLNCWLAFDVTYVTPEGEAIHGITAIAPRREAVRKWEGDLTEERIAEAITKLNALSAEEKAQPRDVRAENIEYARLQELEDIRDLLNRSFSSSLNTVNYWTADRLVPGQAKDFYGNRIRLLKEWLDSEDGAGRPESEKAALIARYEALPTPLHYEYNLGWEQTLLMLSALIMPMMLVICFLAAGIFSAEFTWKSDSVLFSAAYGRKQAVSAKIRAGIGIASALYFSSVALFTAITLSVFGTSGAYCPLQILPSGWTSVYSITLLQDYLLAVLCGFVATLFLTLLTMLVSALTGSAVVAVVVPFVVLFLPSFLSGVRSSTLTRILDLLPDRLLDMRSLLRSFSFYSIAGKSVHALPLLLIIYCALIPVLAIASYRIYRNKQAG